MRLITHSLFQLALIVLFILTSCSGKSNTGIETPSSTPNPCAPNQIGKEIDKINELMRAFDDATFIANLTDQKLLAQPIMEMQAIRRQVENLEMPSCLKNLQVSAISYMNMVINYLAHFMGGISQEQINAEIAASQNLRIAYEEEIARQIGATYVPPPTRIPVTPATPKPTQENNSSSTQPAEKTPVADPKFIVTNTSQASINIRLEPSLTSAIVGYLQPEETAQAIGRTTDSEWIAILLTNSSIAYAWVYSENVTLNVPVEQLPTPDPTPTGVP